MDKQVIQEILAVAKRLDDKQLVNAYEGNISIKRDGYLYVTPSGKNKAMLTEDMICVFNQEGHQVSGNFAPSSELKMHTGIYPMRDNIGGIIHAHPPFLTAYALCCQSFTNLAYAEMLWDHKDIELVPYGRPGTDDIYVRAKLILDKGRDIMLLANHGVLAVGKTVFDALNKLESAENAAKITVIAKIIGPLSELDPKEVQILLNM